MNRSTFQMIKYMNGSVFFFVFFFVFVFVNGQVYESLRKQAYSNMLKILPPKNENFRIKILIFSYFCSKHSLWVLVRTASARRL